MATPRFTFGQVPLASADLNTMGVAIDQAQAQADYALSVAQSAVGGTVVYPTSAPLPRVVTLQSFITGAEVAGSTVSYDTLLTRATTYAAAQTIVPAIMIGLDDLETYTLPRTTYQGMKIIGAGYMGWPMPQLASSKYSSNRIRVNCGVGHGNAWWNGSGTQYGGYFENLSFESTNQNTQFFSYPLSVGTAYCWGFRTMGFQGFKHVFGQGTTATAAITAWTISGSWTITTPIDIQCSFGGSDSDLWTDGSCNIGAAGGTSFLGGGKPLMMFSSMGKTNIGGIFFTCDGGWRGVDILGTPSFGPGLKAWGWRIEGRNADDPSFGALIRVKSGHLSLRDSSVSYAMSSPTSHPDATDQGVIQVTGGVFRGDMLTYDRSTTIAETVPFIYVSGGKASISNVDVGAKGGSWTGLPRAYQTVNGLLRKDDTLSWGSGSATG